MDRHSSYSAPRSERASGSYGGNRGRSTKRNTYNKRSWNDNRKLHTLVFYILPFILINLVIFIVATSKPKIEYDVSDTRDYRSVDRPTDVLSFPSNEGDALSAVPDGFLGDIAISIDRAKAQAEEYGHSFERELSFLTVHGCLHILGYDHMNDEERQEMFALQDKILNDMGITR